MNDIPSKIKAEERAEGQRSNEEQPQQQQHRSCTHTHAHGRVTESETNSALNSHSTGRKTNATTVLMGPPSLPPPQAAKAISGPPAPPPPPQPLSEQAVSAQEAEVVAVIPNVYNDHNAPKNPGEDPKLYCMEGTPTCFSRVSSLSSLNSSDAVENHQDDSGALHDEEERKEVGDDDDDKLQEGYSPGKSETGNSEAVSNVPAKSVTFDEHKQVDETPMMFSRSSSLGSLSSFDTHSVHSSVVSEYSRRASEVVSPSDLPDSPSDTMPPSPNRSKSPTKFTPDQHLPAVHKQSEKTNVKNQAMDTPVKPVPVLKTSANKSAAKSPIRQSQAFEKDSMLTYAVEGSPGEFSTRSSLSALTFDDEPKIAKEPDLEKVTPDAEGDFEEEDQEEGVGIVPQLDEARVIKTMDDIESDSSVSDAEAEDMLAQCISSAMPNNSKKKSKSGGAGAAGTSASSAENLPKKKGLNRINNFQSPKETNANRNPRLPPKVPNGAMSPRVASPNPHGAAFVMPAVNVDDFAAEDCVNRYATEGTPHNFSTATSLSDLSLIPDDEPSEVPGERPQATGQSALDDITSDTSSLCDESEDLLSEAIQSAMPTPKPKKKNPPTSTAVAAPPAAVERLPEGSDAVDQEQLQYQAFKKPFPVFLPQRTSSVNSNQRPSTGSEVPRTYATEDTPVQHLSTATSLSDLTIDSTDDGEVKGRKGEGQIDDNEAEKSFGNQTQESNAATVGSNTQDDSVFIQHSYDSPVVFGVEDTPVSFSRNDSLSSLSCDEDMDIPQTTEKAPQSSSRREKPQLPAKKMLQSPRSRLLSPRRATGDANSGGFLAPSKVKAPGGGGDVYGKTSPPGVLSQHASASQGSSRRASDSEQPLSYDVEGTPMCFSQNSSLSSLNSDDHEDLANKSSSPKTPAAAEAAANEKESSFQVEGTPMCFSRNSSLSSLSVESLSFDPTPSEQALLEECINSAMPKKTPSKSKSSRPPRGVPPPGGGTVTAPRTSPTTVDGQKSARRNLSPKLEEEGAKNGLCRGPETATSGKNNNNNLLETELGTSPLRRDDTKACESPTSNTTAWRRAPHRSSDDLKKSPSSENKFGWRRAHSQDSESFIKRKKELTNQERVRGEVLTCEVAPMQSHHSMGALSQRRSEEPQRLNALDDSFECGDDDEDNRLMESVITIKRSETFDKELLEAESPSDEKYDEKSEKENKEMEESDDKLFSDRDMPDFDAVSDSEADITAETFPDDLPMDESITIIKSTDSEKEITGNGSDPASAENTLVESPGKDGNDSCEVEGKAEGAEIDSEDEMALEKNAKLILTELSFKRDMSSSTLSEDGFIDNETLSLVSNDYTSDTCSEVSLTLSNSSKATSDRTSDISSSTLSQHSSAHSVTVGRPRILNERSIREQAQNAAKLIRGRKKSASSLRSFSSASSKSTSAKSGDVGNKVPVRPGARGGISKIAAPKSGITPTKKLLVKPGSAVAAKNTITPPKAGNKLGGSPLQKTPPSGKTTPQKSGLPQRGLQKPLGPRTSPPGAAQRSSSPKGVKNASPRSKIGGSGKSSPREAPEGATSSNSPKAETGGSKIPMGKIPQRSLTVVHVERPKPPIKQGTFTKESTTTNAPNISPSKVNKADSKSELSDIKLRERKARAESPPGSNRSSGESQSSSGSWSKALGSFNFIVDTSQDQDVNSPFKASPNPNAKRRNQSPASISRRESSPAARRSGSGDRAKKTGAMRREGSASSVKSISSNKSTTPNKNPRTIPKANLKKSDSNSSIKKTTMNGRPPTPSGRKTPSSVKSDGSAPGGGSGKKPIGMVGKKQVGSRIAGLWRRDEAGSPAQEKNSSTSSSPESSSPASQSVTPNKVGQRSPKVARKLMTPSKIGRGLPRKNSATTPTSTPVGGATSTSRVQASPAAAARTKASPPAKTTPAVPQSRAEPVCTPKVAPSPTPIAKNISPKEGISRSSTYDKLDVPKTDSAIPQNAAPEETPVAEQKTTIKPPEKTKTAKESKMSIPKASGIWRKTPAKKAAIPKTEEVKNNEVDAAELTKTAEKKQLPKPKMNMWRRNKEPAKTIPKAVSPPSPPETKEGDFEEEEDEVWVRRDGTIPVVKPGSRSSIPMPGNKRPTPGVGGAKGGQGQNNQGGKITQNGKTGHGENTQGVNTNTQGGKKAPQKHPEDLLETPIDNNSLVISPVSSPTKPSAPEMRTVSPVSAIVPPFNYTPKTQQNNQQQQQNNKKDDVQKKNTINQQQSTIPPSPTKTLTKTEMLIARRRSYLNSIQPTDAEDESGERKSCLVTTV